MGTHVLILMVLLAMAVTVSAAGFPPELESGIKDADLLYLATQRKDGSRSEAAPVWFGVLDGVIYVNTGTDSHKVKRVRRGSPVFIALKKDGPFVEAKAVLVTDPTIADRLGEQYAKKYWIAWLGLFRPRGTRVAAGKTALIKITPKGT